MIHKVERKIGKETIIIETGSMAKQANGAVRVQYGGTMVLVTAVCSNELREGIDFFPLTVEYQEKTYAAGRIPGGFFKREGRPTEKEILTSRLIDRPIRPLFPKGFVNDVQVVAIVLSSDGQNDSDIPAIIGASCALAISDIPFTGPIGAVRIGLVGGEFVINPTFKELEESSLNLVSAGLKDKIIMLEAGANQISEEKMLEAIELSQEYIKVSIELQEELKKKCGKEKTKPELKLVSSGLHEKVRKISIDELKKINALPAKEQREDAFNILARQIIEKLTQEDEGLSEFDIKNALYEVEKTEVRKFILEKKIRIDTRKYEDIRPINCEVGLLPRTHGSGLFTRGQTQSLSITTLGTSQDEQRMDTLEGEKLKSFMLHYNFPPFSVGETKPMRGPGRREIGHGALAERALKAVMPSNEEFPYTVRVVSEILESNGSSSMATVCASTLSLMDAGVPITKPVSGIAMGLIKEENEVAILTDIAGLEDHYGDMDLKVAGTDSGVTALQMDLKIDGIDMNLIRKIVKQANPARAFILNKIIETINAPRKELSEYAPRITTLMIDKEKIGALIGPGGKIIKRIIQDTGATIEVDDEGKVSVASDNEEASRKAIDIIKGITSEPEVGTIYEATVKKIMNFGAFCEILPGKEGLVHVSELSDKFVKNAEDVVKIGDKVRVKLIKIDEMGRLNLSIKQASQ
ncbi:MAG: polyribonucleotide nucleotidyltransferase [Omnitrophica bacterium GWA2_41_15]|nr:MAG: polyribonucleotide nucleotidyltransferase [Omnitrophica bacterium GWA2_41_15]HAZ10963.1 polyribonucleotide nucleotidyltransferase [Candidatus Omnitrophota bacterium]